MSASVTEVARTALTSSRSRARDLKEQGFSLLLVVSLGIAIVVLVALLAFMIVEGWPRIDSRLWTEFPSARRVESAGFRSAIFGTIWVMGVVLSTAIPLGLGAAIYLEEFADGDRWYNRLIELNIQNLAAVPSIVYGILGLAFIARGALGLGQTVLAAGLTLTLLVLPVVIISSREALRAVPDGIRQAALGLGATPWQAVSRQVLPAAIPGIATGVILSLSRAIGEAAPLLLLGALTFITFNPDGLLASFTVLPIQIFNYISRPQPEFAVLAAAGIVVLLALLLAMNSVAIWLRNRYGRQW